MARSILLLFLLLFCISDISVQNQHEASISEDISINLPFNTFAVVDASEMCKPTGVETVTFTEGRTEPAPEKKKPVTKASKKKTTKKVRQKSV
ncbi:hypothetical protein ACX0HA_05830 [Flavobacterium hauense]